MPDLSDTIMAMTPAARHGALVALDAASRPLAVREIEEALRAKGVSHSRSVIIASALKGLAIIAVVGPEHG
jgi:hypothetical protein